MPDGTCRIIVDGADAGQVEYKYNISGHGHLWMTPDLLMDAFSSTNVALRIGDTDQEIIISSATPGEAAPFTFRSLQRQQK